MYVHMTVKIREKVDNTVCFLIDGSNGFIFINLTKSQLLIIHDTKFCLDIRKTS
ncbi:hypothetical protein Hanom_Chr01g00002241 [Helianthus anomalus]